MRNKSVRTKEQDQRDLLIYAFRYCLGRRTYCVSTMVNVLKGAWENLSDFDKELIKKEIKEHKETFGNLGDQFDEDAWLEILDLK